MADLKVRNLDEAVARALRKRARARGVSVEEEVRAALADSVATKRAAFVRRAAASRAATRPRDDRPPSDSTPGIRRERDAWG
ncbi:MAG TPA: hypothetical protein VKW76_09515 [Candidatus Binatia bacterium]|nr:hypothetical protein [Candidatus Binatia bacterium]